MNGSLGSPPRQKVTMAMIDSVPPIAPREEIEYVIKNVYSFFRYQARLNYSFLPLAVKYFVHPAVPETKLTEDEAKQIELFSKKYRSQMFAFLAERPQICRAAVEKIAFRQVSLSQRKNFYYELMQIAFYSDSLELFKLAMVDTPRPPAKRTLRNPVTPVLSHIERVERSVGLFIDEESKVGEFAHFLDEIPSTTAVAASPTVVFVGKKGGEVRVLTTVGKGLNVRSFLLKAVGPEPYSLVWVHQSLWMITGSDVWKLHSLESEPVAVEKPAKMGMAVCTDGHYFYAFKRSEVNVFEFDGSVFVFLRTVKLNPSVCAVADELNVSFVADGGLISFAVQRKKEMMFKSYSLVTGKLISSHVSSSLIDICGWCIRPFSNEHVLLSKLSMTLYHGVLQMPRWLMCVRYPVITEENPIQSALEVALYHGASFFESGSALVLHQLLEGYCATGDNVGIMIVGHILLRIMEVKKDDWTRLAELFASYYSKCKSEPTMQRFCCFMYLACMKSSLGVVKSSVFSEYVMTEAKDLDFIFVFPSAIRFNCEYISPKAMDKIIEHCVDAWLSFPCEASFLIQEYIRNYMKPMFKKGEIGSVIGALQKIMNGITQVVNLVLNNMRDAESFCSSGQFSVWGYILMMIREEKKYWPRFGHQLIPLLQLGLHNQNVDRPSLAKIRDMMNRTMVVLLELIFAVPKHISFVQFKTEDAFYQRYPSVMRGYDSELDQLIIKLLASLTKEVIGLCWRSYLMNVILLMESLLISRLVAQMHWLQYKMTA